MWGVDYWERRYAAGQGSGRGSRGEIAAFKARTVNAFAAEHGVRSVLDIGSGDGFQAALLDVPGYHGVDPSPTAVATARRRCPQRSFAVLERDRLPLARDLHLSMDVMFHLVEDASYEDHLRLLFSALRYVVVHATDCEALGHPHVRHRHWTVDVPTGWKRVELIVSRLASADMHIYQRCT